VAGSRQLRVFLSAFGGAGHVFPVLALAERLSDRGHDVWVETIERWRQPAADMGLRFVQAPDYIALRQPLPGMAPPPTHAEIGV
jgi:UDP:flavonoid glycosyltransferase YjiC (YdhE family)